MGLFPDEDGSPSGLTGGWTIRELIPAALVIPEAGLSFRLSDRWSVLVALADPYGPPAVSYRPDWGELTLEWCES